MELGNVLGASLGLQEGVPVGNLDGLLVGESVGTDEGS